MRNGRRLVVAPAIFLAISVVALGCSSSATPSATPMAPMEETGHETDQQDASHAGEDDADHEAGQDADQAGEDDSGHVMDLEATLSGAALTGLGVFRAVGCSSCHGDDAAGTSIAPALSGHSASMVRRQVRAPTGLMPLFPRDKVSDSQLDVLVAFVSSLPADHAHVKAVDLGAAMEMHHWMALLTLEGGNAGEGRHHVQHIIGLTEGDHRARMVQIISTIEAGDLHDAAHDIQQMLAGVLEEGLPASTVHLRLALSSARVSDVAEVRHHLRHFIESSEGADREEGEALLAVAQDLPAVQMARKIEDLLHRNDVVVEEADPGDDDRPQ